MTPSNSEDPGADAADQVGPSRTQIAAELRKAAADQRVRSAESLRVVEQFLRKHETFDVLGWHALSQLSIDPETYSESLHRGSAAKLEYLVLQALRLGYAPGEEYAPDGTEWVDFLDALESVFALPFMLDLLDATTAPGDGEGDELIGHVVRSHETFVRAPGYPVHQERLLRHLFEPFNAELQAVFGFNVDNAIVLSRIMPRLVDDRLNARRAGVSRMVNSLTRSVEAVRRGRATPVASGIPQQMVEQFARLNRLMKNSHERMVPGFEDE